MPKAVRPRWGLVGAVCVRGAGRTDEQVRTGGILAGRSEDRGQVLTDNPWRHEDGAVLTDDQRRHLGILRGERGDRGCRHDDQQLDILASFVNAPADKIRARLDWIREFYLTSLLYRARAPQQRECNAALSIVADHIKTLEAAISALPGLPNWDLSEGERVQAVSRVNMLWTLPRRLRTLARLARSAATDLTPEGKHQAPFLRSLAENADRLADAVFPLDFVSQDEVRNRLPLTRDYKMEGFCDVAQLMQRFDDAVGKALAAGRRRGGPRPFSALVQTVAWLLELYEECGGRFTHTPRDKMRYDGTPHSPAGRFLTAFFELCDPACRQHSISSAMAKVKRAAAAAAPQQAVGGSF